MPANPRAGRSELWLYRFIEQRALPMSNRLFAKCLSCIFELLVLKATWFQPILPGVKPGRDSKYGMLRRFKYLITVSLRIVFPTTYSTIRLASGDSSHLRIQPADGENHFFLQGWSASIRDPERPMRAAINDTDRTLRSN
jgi:hypothetical protein